MKQLLAPEKKEKHVPKVTIHLGHTDQQPRFYCVIYKYQVKHMEKFDQYLCLNLKFTASEILRSFLL